MLLAAGKVAVTVDEEGGQGTSYGEAISGARRFRSNGNCSDVQSYGNPLFLQDCPQPIPSGMCNAYRCGEEIKAQAQVREGLRLNRSNYGRLIRRTGRGPVVREDGSLVEMRWGFERPRFGTINNSREDKLDSPMWRAAYRERRCLIPATGYYEFSGPKGAKQAHLFTRSDGIWMWIAGLWEDSPEHGLCYSMVTTDPNDLVATIHDRMPAVLEPHELDDWLEGKIRHFKPSALSLRIDPAANPLKRDWSPDSDGVSEGQLPLL